MYVYTRTCVILKRSGTINHAVSTLKTYIINLLSRLKPCCGAFAQHDDASINFFHPCAGKKKRQKKRQKKTSEDATDQQHTTVEAIYPVYDMLQLQTAITALLLLCCMLLLSLACAPNLSTKPWRRAISFCSASYLIFKALEQQRQTSTSKPTGKKTSHDFCA